MSDNLPEAPQGEFILFRSEDGQTRVECRFESDTLWLSLTSICELTVKLSPRLVSIFAIFLLRGELSKIQLFGFTEQLRMMLAVQCKILQSLNDPAIGYRVRSVRGTQFRQWATQTLEQYLIKGFVMDDERLKNPPIGQSVVPDYFFDEMLERIRDIRASERRVHNLRVKEIFTMAADYEPSNKRNNSSLPNHPKQPAFCLYLA